MPAPDPPEIEPSWFVRDPLDADYAIVGVEEPRFPRDAPRPTATTCMAFVARRGKANLAGSRVIRGVRFPPDGPRTR